MKIFNNDIRNIVLILTIIFSVFFGGQVRSSNIEEKPAGNSFYTHSLIDTQAVYLTPENFDVTVDAPGDDSKAIQEAINKIAEKNVFGVVFVPQGSYQISKIIYLWKGIRLIGYGEKRPVFVLEENTPGYQEGQGRYMVQFVSNKPKDGRPIRDANPGTFYSAISNINFEIKKDNPAAIAVRSHVAQHCYIAHVDFYIGDGRAGIEKVGNEVDDCRFFGGDFGIITTKPSPSWPFLMIDTIFNGQRKAAISTEEGGLTLVRNQFKNAPSAIIANPERAEELFMDDCRMENISGPAIVISDENNPRSQYNFKNLVCDNVPVLVTFRKSPKQIVGQGKFYKVNSFTHGLQIDDLGYAPELKTTYDISTLTEMPSPVKSDIPELPSATEWANLLDLGAKGDGKTDDTKIIKEAIKNHQSIYLPTGRYLVSETILLKKNTVLIGLNPITTQLVLTNKSTAFSGAGAPVALLETPAEGTNIITGIGLDTGAFNERAVAAKWMAGSTSLMNDVRFIGSHGTYNSDGSRVPVYNESRTSDPYKNRDWDSQYWSLWITNGGGGTFKDIWTPNSYAQAGIYISDTQTPGRIYAMSVEHHIRNEVMLKNVSNWKIYDLQMEEESAESSYALPLRIDNCSNITFANLYLYRVIRIVSPYPNGVLLNSSYNIEFCGIHVYSPTKFSFNNTIYDQTSDFQIRQREIARLYISGKSAYPVIVPGDDKRVEKVVGGFEFIDGATTDDKGNIYFVDGRWQRIYKWSPEGKKLSLIKDTPLGPVGLSMDQSGNLLVVTRRGDVVTFHTDSSEMNLKKLKLVPADSHKGKIAVLPGHLWRDEHDFLKITTYSKENPPITHSSFSRYQSWRFRDKEPANPLENHFVSSDGSTFIPQHSDLIRAFSLRKAFPGKPFYMADEFGQKTYKFSVNQDGSLFNPVLFAERGELDVTSDSNGRVYIAAGDIFVYDKSGHQIDVIKVPERPTNLIFAGKNNKTLYVTARSSLYKVKID